MAHVRAQVAFGPRPPGSPALQKCRDYIISQMKSFGYEIGEDAFTAQTPYGPIRMNNLIARKGKGNKRIIALATHYDTKLMEGKNFVGANDAGSSTGLLIELARVLAANNDDSDYWFLFLDGEEAFIEWSTFDSTYGSRHLAQRWKTEGVVPKIRALILLDMIGDKNLDIWYEKNSTKRLMDLAWETADKIGLKSILSTIHAPVEDDHYLLDKKEGELPEASVFVTGANEWRSFDAWPPANVTDRKIYLQPDGILSFLTPSVSESFDEYISDPMKPVPYTEKVNIHRTTEYMTDDQRFASRRPDVMVYQTDTLSQELTLTGPLVADLFVSTTGTDADYVVKLIDVFPQDMMAPDGKDLEIKLGGYQMLVRGEVIRGRFRNSFENPEPFKPGKVTEVKYEIPDIAHSFKKGHRIMIQVQNSWFPLVDRNPQKFVDIYQCGDEDFQKATHRIYHDKQHPSYIQIKTLN